MVLLLSCSSRHLSTMLLILICFNLHVTILANLPPQPLENKEVNYVALVNSSVTLMCPFKDSVFAYTWVRESGEVNDEQPSFATDQLYTLRTPRRPTQLKFKCTAIGGFGSAFRILTVKVIDRKRPQSNEVCYNFLDSRPRTVLGPCFLNNMERSQQSVSLFIGSTGTLDCEAAMGSDPAIKSGVLLYSWNLIPSSGVNTQKSILLPNNTPTLTLEKAQLKDAGEYRCRVRILVPGESDERNLFRKFNVNVQENNNRTVIVGTRSERISIQAGEDVILKCRTNKDYGIPVVKWSRVVNEKPVKNTDMTFFISGNQFHRLLQDSQQYIADDTSGDFITVHTLTNVDTSVSGRYVCSAIDSTTGFVDMKYVDVQVSPAHKKTWIFIIVPVCVILIVAGVTIYCAMSKCRQKREMAYTAPHCRYMQALGLTTPPTEGNSYAPPGSGGIPPGGSYYSDGNNFHLQQTKMAPTSHTKNGSSNSSGGNMTGNGNGGMYPSNNNIINNNTNLPCSGSVVCPSLSPPTSSFLVDPSIHNYQPPPPSAVLGMSGHGYQGQSPPHDNTVFYPPSSRSDSPPAARPYYPPQQGVDNEQHKHRHMHYNPPVHSNGSPHDNNYQQYAA